MGQFTIYDQLIDNPGRFFYRGDRLESYLWQLDVRAICDDGTVTKIGRYDMYGHVVVGSRKHDVSYGGNALLIADATFQAIISHPFYSCFSGKLSVYELVNKFIGVKDVVSDLALDVDAQFFTILTADDVDTDDRVTESSDKIYCYTDPKEDTDNGRRNKERIGQTIDRMYMSACSTTLLQRLEMRVPLTIFDYARYGNANRFKISKDNFLYAIFMFFTCVCAIGMLEKLQEELGLDSGTESQCSLTCSNSADLLY